MLTQEDQHVLLLHPDAMLRNQVRHDALPEEVRHDADLAGHAAGLAGHDADLAGHDAGLAGHHAGLAGHDVLPEEAY